MQVNRLHLNEANRIFAAIQLASIAELGEGQQIDQDIQALSAHDEDLPAGVKRQSSELQTERAEQIIRLNYSNSYSHETIQSIDDDREIVCRSIQSEINSYGLTSEELPID